MKIIAASGKRGSGKSTFASHLVGKHGALTLSFAGPLRRELVALGYPADMIYAKPTPGPIRVLMVAHGQARRFIDPDYWIKQLWKDLGRAQRAGAHLVAIDDLRFWNEAERLRESGAVLVRLGIADPLYREQFVQGVDDDQSETDLDQWADWDFAESFRKGDIDGIASLAERAVAGLFSEEGTGV